MAPFDTHAKRSRAPAQTFAAVPDDVLALMVAHLQEVPDLLRLAETCKRFRGLVANEHMWEKLFTKRFGSPSRLQIAAHKIAGTWLALYKSKSVTDKAADPWRKPSEFELKAALHELAHSSSSTSSGSSSSATASPGSPSSSSSSTSTSSGNNNTPIGRSDSTTSSANDMADPAAAADGEIDQLCVVFLVDGSGSVGEEDFTCMTNFLETAAETVSAVPNSKVCVVQFSNDTRVEVALGPWDKAGFETGIKNMVRMNGGTNIAAAVAKAGSLFKATSSCGPTTRRVLVLLTDGRIDSYQAKEAGQMVAQLADEQAHVGLWAFGVGRGVDAAELMRIIEGPGESAKGLGKERYVELCVRDDAPW